MCACALIQIQVGTNGYFTFTGYTGWIPFLFDGNTLPLVAPFFADIDISNGVGQINYEVHTDDISDSLLSQVNSLISDHAGTEFNGRWMLVATWDQVPPYQNPNIVIICCVLLFCYNIVFIILS